MISVCMPVFNREAYLAEAIDSVLNQSYKDFELIIVDDGSTDSTPRLLEHYSKKDKRIKVITTPNQGIAKARNTAIINSSGEYICVMDSDDLMSPDRLKISLKNIKNVDFVYSSYLQADEHAQVFNGVEPKSKITKEDVYNNSAWPHVTIMAKRRCFEENPYREECKVNDDTMLVLDWFKAGYTYKKISQPLMIVRYHPQSTSATKQKEIDKVTEQMRRELE